MNNQERELRINVVRFAFRRVKCHRSTSIVTGAVAAIN
jgi:hypothetical protein